MDTSWLDILSGTLSIADTAATTNYRTDPAYKFANNNAQAAGNFSDAIGDGAAFFGDVLIQLRAVIEWLPTPIAVVGGRIISTAGIAAAVRWGGVVALPVP